jgi:hypothetical protein
VSSNVQKTPFVSTLNRFAEGKTSDAGQIDGKALPASVVAVNGSIVTVKFEIQDPTFTLPSVTVPVFGPEYVRYPIQAATASAPGTFGMVVSADAYLGGMSGLGGGVAGLVQQGNLATLVFLPIGNKNWVAAPNANAVVIYGVNGNGVVLLDKITGSMASITLTSAGLAIVGNTSIQGNLTVTGAITATGNITAGFGSADQVDLLQHKHSGAGGTGTSGPPVPGS